MKLGLGISTYFTKDFDPRRLESFKKSMSTLLSSKFSGAIYLVDDGSEVFHHLDYIKEIDIQNRITIFKRGTNGGISKVKNTCLRLLMENGTDLLFLADDDVNYL